MKAGFFWRVCRVGLMGVFCAGVLLCAGLGLAEKLNVKDYGARGDGVTNDTLAIRNAINAANNAAGVNTVYFPAGTYMCNDIPLTAAENRGAVKLDSPPADLVFEGDGARVSILKRRPGGSPQQNRIATIAAGRNLTFQRLGFDANGIDRYGGIWGYGCSSITVQRVWCFDSNVVGPNGFDRYMFGFVGDSTNIRIQDSLWQDLQLEVDDCRRVRILRNVVERPRETGGIGVWGVNDGLTALDYIIEENWIVDPSRVNGGAFMFQLDQNDTDGCEWRNFIVRNNTIIYPAAAVGARRPVAMKLGAHDSSDQTSSGTIFDQIQITGNRIYVDPGLTGFSRDFIWFWHFYPKPLLHFDNTTVASNTLYHSGSYGPLSISPVAKGVNWLDANNVKTGYVSPPPVPDPLSRPSAPSGLDAGR